MNEGLDMSRYPSAPEVRQWAMSKRTGANLLAMGQLPKFVILGWNKAHPERPYVPAQSFHGTNDGYQAHGCRCLGCVAIGRATGRARYRLGIEDHDEAAS